MKAKLDINFRNPKAFDKLGRFTGEESSYFTVKKGEELSEVLKANGHSDEEVAKAEVRILKGNPHWLEAKSEDEKKKVVEVKKDKESEEKRYAELKSEKKDWQANKLKELGAKSIPSYEDGRIKLIMKLEK